MSEEGGEVIEIRSGVIPAARYADKLRRVALVALRNVAPKDVIIRDVSELNRHLYKIIVEERGYGKGDLIRIVVKARYDRESNKIIFSEPVIDRFLPESELEKICESRLGELRKQYEERVAEAERLRAQYERRVKELTSEVERLKGVLRDIRSILDQVEV